jgi:MFS family permease
MNDWSCLFHCLFGTGTSFREYGNPGFHSERRHWIHVSAPWMGTAVLAAFCPEIWQAADLSDIRTWCYWHQHIEVRRLCHHGAVIANRGLSSAYVTSDRECIARCLVMGFFIARIEALPEISITDVYFTHQRGTYMGIYSFALAGSNYFARIICGFVAEHQGWQWVFYWPAIFNAFTFVFLFCFMEETNYQRKSTGVGNAPTSRSAGPAVAIRDTEKPYLTTSQSGAGFRAGTSTKTFGQKLSVWQERSLQYIGWPVIAYCGISYGSYLILFNILNATASIILSGAPYNFSSSMVGLSYVSCMIGVAVSR